jgi:large subunit ribosomal protein L32
MPPLPKKQLAKSRQRSRAAHYKIQGPARSTCSRCHNPKLPHRVCPTCGYYHGRQVINVTSPGEGR